jgi:hypothetical protein
MNSSDVLRSKRDAKAIPHLSQYAPVWLVHETVLLDEEAIQFNVVFQHNLYGWVNRRYRYDGFNDVLHYRGQTLVSDDEALSVQESEPYIAPVIADIPNAYGG